MSRGEIDSMKIYGEHNHKSVLSTVTFDRAHSCFADFWGNIAP